MCTEESLYLAQSALWVDFPKVASKAVLTHLKKVHSAMMIPNNFHSEWLEVKPMAEKSKKKSHIYRNFSLQQRLLVNLVLLDWVIHKSTFSLFISLQVLGVNSCHFSQWSPSPNLLLSPIKSFFLPHHSLSHCHVLLDMWKNKFPLGYCRWCIWAIVEKRICSRHSTEQSSFPSSSRSMSIC